MKVFRMVGMCLMAVLMSLTISSCSDDDDEVSEKSLRGTSWKVTSVSDDGASVAVGGVITFGSNGKGTWLSKEPEGEEDDELFTIYYSVSGSTLTIDVEHDDCMTGTLTEDGNTATYVFYWYDYDGKWSNPDEIYTIKLAKQ